MGYKSTRPKPHFSLSDPLPPEDNMATHSKKATDPRVAPQRVFMTAGETIAAGNLLLQHCKPKPDTKFHQYEKDWSDDKVAKETGERLNGDHIKRLRRQLEMKFDPSASLDYSGKTLQARVSKLQKDIDQVKDIIDGLKDRGTDDFKDLDGRITDVRKMLGDDIDAKDKAYEHYDEKLSSLHSRIDAINSVTTSLQQQIDELTRLATNPVTTEK